MPVVQMSAFSYLTNKQLNQFVCVLMNGFCVFLGVEFGARMVTIDGKQIKLQIWDTVSDMFSQ